MRHGGINAIRRTGAFLGSSCYPPTGTDIVTEAPFEGQTISKLHEEQSSLAKPALKEPTKEPNARLIMVEEEQPVQIVLTELTQ